MCASYTGTRDPEGADSIDSHSGGECEGSTSSSEDDTNEDLRRAWESDVLLYNGETTIERRVPRAQVGPHDVADTPRWLSVDQDTRDATNVLSGTDLWRHNEHWETQQKVDMFKDTVDRSIPMMRIMRRTIQDALEAAQEQAIKGQVRY